MESLTGQTYRTAAQCGPGSDEGGNVRPLLVTEHDDAIRLYNGAMTVHKSQGFRFDTAAVLLPVDRPIARASGLQRRPWA